MKQTKSSGNVYLSKLKGRVREEKRRQVKNKKSRLKNILMKGGWAVMRNPSVSSFWHTCSDLEEILELLHAVTGKKCWESAPQADTRSRSSY